MRPSTPGSSFDERAVIGDVRDRAGEARADRILGFDRAPRIRLELLHAERDALRLGLMRMICTFTVSPTLRISDGWLTRRQAISRDVEQAVDCRRGR